MGLIWSLLIGALAGYLANHFMEREKSSVLRNILLGIAGAFIGDRLLGYIGLDVDSTIMSLLSATAGAVLLIYIVRAIRR